MARGGARANSGRKKGLPNRLNQDRIEAFRASGKKDPFDSTIELHERALREHKDAAVEMAAFAKEHATDLAKARLAPKPSARQQALIREYNRLAGEVDKHGGRIFAYAQGAMPYLHAKLSAKEIKSDDVNDHESALDELDDENEDQSGGAFADD